MEFKKQLNGTLQTTIYNIIPLLIYISKSRITNGRSVHKADGYKTAKFIYSIHVTKYIEIGISI